MDISWLGQSSFRINDDIIDLLVNPEDNIDKSLLSDNTLIVNTDNSENMTLNITKVDSPGEYEINNASIHGVANSVIKDQDRSISTCYRIESRGLSVAVIGMIGSPLDSEALSVLGSSHAVVFSPENTNVDAEILANTIRSIEPRKIIISGFNKSSSKPSKNLDAIIKVLGVKDFEPKSKASFTLSSLGDSQEIIILEK
tara:strand:+ start:1129 stop:1725 length:597 start_codon:yes stop_codon:yes gene_type:complete